MAGSRDEEAQLLPRTRRVTWARGPAPSPRPRRGGVLLLPRKWLSGADSCWEGGGGGGGPGARWRCGRERELAAAGPRELARGLPGAAGECEDLGWACLANGEQTWHRRRVVGGYGGFRPRRPLFPRNWAAGGGVVLRELRPKRWMEPGRPTLVLQARGHWLLVLSGEERGRR